MLGKLLILSADQFIENKGRFYTQRHSYLSLAQYWSLSTTAVVLVKEVESSFNIDELYLCPDHVKVESFNSRALSVAESWDTVYVRMPDFVLLRFWERYLRQLNARLITELHGDWLDSLRIVDYTNNPFIYSVKYLVLPLRYLLTKFRLSRLLQSSDKIVYIGPELLRVYHRSTYKMPLVTSNHTVKKAEVLRGRNKTDNTILFVGELQKRKGLRVLLDSLEGITDIPWHLTVVGGGSELEVLKRRVTKMSMQERVTFTGAIYDSSVLKSYYLDADIFVLPSLRGEGVPRVLQEAQSKGCRVLTTRVGSVEWQLGDTGYIVSPNNVIELRYSLREMFLSKNKHVERENSILNALNGIYEKQIQVLEEYLAV